MVALRWTDPALSHSRRASVKGEGKAMRLRKRYGRLYSHLYQYMLMDMIRQSQEPDL
jgi:hypothetical protein